MRGIGARCAGVLAVVGLLIVVRVAQAEEACVACHSRVLAMVEVQGRTRSVRIDIPRFQHGNHGDLTCDTCHTQKAFTSYPHKVTSVDAVMIETTRVCGDCHPDVAARFAESIHATGRAWRGHPLPICSTCHDPHAPRNPRTNAYRDGIPRLCKQCHDTRYETYLDTYHGQATELGRVAVAKCTDCHGAHDILPEANPASRVNPRRRVQTCRQCHPDATANFASFRVHVDVHSPRSPAVLYWTNLGYLILIVVVFTLAGLHALLYVRRGLRGGMYHWRRHGRGGPTFRRFTLAQRLTHIVALMSFTTAVITGMPLKYAQYHWAQTLMRSLGGVELAGHAHRIAAGFIGSYFVMGSAWLAAGLVRRHRRRLTGPLSIVPSGQDARDFAAMMTWFNFAGPKPEFGRFTYWEKFDFWALMVGTVIIGVTGLIMWFPTVVTRVAPGIVVNVALVIHTNEAILAFGTIFIFMHLFHAHLRPEVFPFDRTIFTGRVPLAEVKEFRGREFRRRFPHEEPPAEEPPERED